MIQGDIEQFAPADLLLFLSHMDKEGVLTVRQDDTALSLSFQHNMIVDGGCDAAEKLILEMLERDGAASPETLAQLCQAHEQTGLPLARILADVESLSVDHTGKAMTAGVRETVFRLMLWDQGLFQFTEFPVDANPHLTPLDTQALIMDLTREVDEYRELLRGLGSLDGHALAAASPDEATEEEQYVLAHARGTQTMHALLDTAPFPRLIAAGAVVNAVNRGWLEVTAAPVAPEPGDDDANAATPFGAYRLALRNLLQATESRVPIRELLNYAQTHCARSILLAIGDDRLKRATVYTRDPSGRLTVSDHRDPDVDLAGDMIFRQTLTSGRPFVGTPFPSPVLEALEAELPAAECALLPLGRMGEYDLLLHAVTAEPGGASGPLACLELLSWQLHAPPLDQPAEVPVDDDGDGHTGGGERLDDGGDATDRLIASIKDLPPMPNVVVRILSLLSDAECDMNAVTEALSHDPALVAQLIKVSNSFLYGGYQETGSINQAIVRLGTRTTRNVVVVVSTRALFPMDNSRIGLLGRALWEHAVHTGLAARRVAEFTRRCDPDEAFASGVLHDIGKVIILLNKPDEYAEVHKRLEDGAGDSLSVEHEVLGFDHCLVGDRLLESWSMPGDLRGVARWHHEPASADEHRALVEVVACGDLLSYHVSNGGIAGGQLDDRLDEACEALGLDDTARGELVDLLRQDLEHSDLLG